MYVRKKLGTSTYDSAAEDKRNSLDKNIVGDRNTFSSGFFCFLFFVTICNLGLKFLGYLNSLPYFSYNLNKIIFLSVAASKYCWMSGKQCRP